MVSAILGKNVTSSFSVFHKFLMIRELVSVNFEGQLSKPIILSLFKQHLNKDFINSHKSTINDHLIEHFHMMILCLKRIKEESQLPVPGS